MEESGLTEDDRYTVTVIVQEITSRPLCSPGGKSNAGPSVEAERYEVTELEYTNDVIDLGEPELRSD